MIVKVGYMPDHYDECDLFLAAASSTKTADGALVMDSCVLGALETEYGGLGLALGERVDNMSRYGLIISEQYPSKKLGLFQVRQDSTGALDYSIIRRSTGELYFFMNEFPDTKVFLEMPDVDSLNYILEDLLYYLTDNVTVWVSCADYADE